MAVSEEAKKVRRTYSRGLHEGLRLAGFTSKEDAMNNARMRAIEQGLSGIAKKVLEAVPIENEWTTSQIITEMRRVTGAYPDKHVVDGCISALMDSKLIKEASHGHYTRVMSKPEPEPQSQPMLVSVSQPVPEPQPEMPMDRLAKLAEDLRKLATTAEDIALDIEAQIQKARADTAKFKQLQELLKGV